MAAAATAAAPFLFYALITRAGLGLDGAAVAFVACQAITLAGLVAFVAARARKLEGHPEQTWGGFSREAFKGWGGYLNYGGPFGGGSLGGGSKEPLKLG
jgi:MATE family multidrug resistance protein